MLARCVAVAFLLLSSLAAWRCPTPSGRDAAPCNAPATPVTIARCVADARTTETCADRATGAEHALYLTRAGSEWRKAAMATGSRTAQARRWLAHAMVLDERVQDDPDAPLDVRKRAKHDEQLARGALKPR